MQALFLNAKVFLLAFCHVSIFATALKRFLPLVNENATAARYYLAFFDVLDELVRQHEAEAFDFDTNDQISIRERKHTLFKWRNTGAD